ncbi:hypothetical protein BTO18_15230 [Polaribacter porphyrae]|uniref:Uncharacterized protein n=1 Tax=Polaribacter porphyrae TaxID=1137780 RepID=A0A2S7WS70_9FLAO|nr:hypothetical protein BTO18_15230 [Polaribacter porphyrae]
MIKFKEWKKDIKAQEEKINKSHRKLLLGISKYKHFSKLSLKVLNYLIKKIEKRNIKKIRVY